MNPSPSASRQAAIEMNTLLNASIPQDVDISGFLANLERQRLVIIAKERGSMSNPSPNMGVRSVHQNTPIGAVPPKPTSKQMLATKPPTKRTRPTTPSSRKK